MFNLSFYNFLYVYIYIYMNNLVKIILIILVLNFLFKNNRVEKFSDSNYDFTSNVSYKLLECDSDSQCIKYADSETDEKYGICNVTDENGETKKRYCLGKIDIEDTCFNKFSSESTICNSILEETQKKKKRIQIKKKRKNKEELPEIKCHPTCKTCGYYDNPTDEKDCISCKDDFKHYQIYEDGTGVCIPKCFKTIQKINSNKLAKNLKLNEILTLSDESQSTILKLRKVVEGITQTFEILQFIDENEDKSDINITGNSDDNFKVTNLTLECYDCKIDKFESPYYSEDLTQFFICIYIYIYEQFS